MKQSVTVAIPVYNGELFIKDALSSIASQTTKVDEIVICDNLSTDKTIKIIEEFAFNHKDLKINVYVNQKNIGFQNNFIECYKNSNTNYLLLLQVDDILKPNAIEILLKFYNSNANLAVVGGHADIIDLEGKMIIKNSLENDMIFEKNELYEFIKETSSYILFSTVMYNLDLLKDIPYLNEESIAPEELYWPLVLKEFSIAVLGKSIINNRRYAGQMHNYNAVFKFSEYLLHFDQKIRKHELETNEHRKRETKKVIERQVAQISITLGKDSYVYFKKVNITAKYFMYAFKKCPSIFFSKYFLRTVLKMFSIIK